MGIHRIRCQLHCLVCILLGLVPLLLVEQHFGVECQRQGVIRVQQVGTVGSCFPLRQVALAFFSADQVGGGIPIQHEGVDSRDGTVVGGELDRLFNRDQGFLQAGEALLVGAEGGGGVSLDACQLGPYQGVLRVDLKCLLVCPDGVLVGDGVVQLTSGKVSLCSHDVRLGRAGRSGCGVERRLHLPAVEREQQPGCACNQCHPE